MGKVLCGGSTACTCNSMEWIHHPDRTRTVYLSNYALSESFSHSVGVFSVFFVCVRSSLLSVGDCVEKVFNCAEIPFSVCPFFFSCAVILSVLCVWWPWGHESVSKPTLSKALKSSEVNIAASVFRPRGCKAEWPICRSRRHHLILDSASVEFLRAQVASW